MVKADAKKLRVSPSVKGGATPKMPLPRSASPKDLAKRALQVRAVELRIKGWHYWDIARELQLKDVHAVRDLIEGMFKIWDYTLHERAQQMRIIESARLDTLQMGIWDDAAGGSLAAIDRVLAIMARRAKLWGLDKERDEAVMQIVQLVQSHGLNDSDIETMLEARRMKDADLVAALEVALEAGGEFNAQTQVSPAGKPGLIKDASGGIQVHQDDVDALVSGLDDVASGEEDADFGVQDEMELDH